MTHHTVSGVKGDGLRGASRARRLLTPRRLMEPENFLTRAAIYIHLYADTVTRLALPSGLICCGDVALIKFTAFASYLNTSTHAE